MDQNAFQPKGAQQLAVRPVGPQMGDGGVFGKNQSSQAQLSPMPSPAPTQIPAQIGQANAPKGAQPVSLVQKGPQLGSNPVGAPANTPSRAPAVGRQGSFQASPGSFTPSPGGLFGMGQQQPQLPQLPKLPISPKGLQAAAAPELSGGTELHVVKVEVQAPNGKVLIAPIEIETPRGSKLLGVTEEVQ
jgi:hypothetical protein